MTSLPDLEDLSLLIHVARLGSIGRTAAELGLSQPSVSRRMAALERSLHVSLLTRTPRGTSLTPSGRVVVDWATTLLEAAEHFDRSVAVLSQQRKVTVRAAVSMTLAEHHAPRWVARLDRMAPDCIVSLMVHNSSEVADLVESGDADIGFVESPTVRRSLRRRRIGWDSLVVAVAPDHPWAVRRRPLTAEEVAASRLLVRERGSGTRETLDAAMRAAGLELTTGQVFGSNAALKSAAVAGLAPVVLSGLSLAHELAAGTLVDVPVDGLDLRRPLSAVWRREGAVPEAVMTLLKVAASGP
jgi:DNA-binding transcriptional LysR family regulator